LRVGVAALVAVIAAGLVGTVLSLHRPNQPLEVFQFVQLLESGINDVVLVGAGVFFLLTLETRIKRRRPSPRSASCARSRTSSTCTSSPRTRSGS
jgi:hypothetical protein